MNREEIISLINAERERQFDLPGSEWDARHGPNDWMAIAAHYLTECVQKGNALPDDASFKDSFIKAAAIMVAALEHTDTMCNAGRLARK